MFRLMTILTISGFLLCKNGVSSDNVSGCSESLGVEDRNKITDGQMTASSIKSIRHRPYFGRLNNVKKGWCPKTTNDHQWLQVDFNETRTVTAVSIQGDPADRYLYVASYAILYSYDGRDWFNYTIDMKVHIFSGSTDATVEKKTSIRYPITARFIRINPRTWSETAHGFCLRVEFYGCTPKEDCFTPVGMEDGRIKDDQISSSDTYNQHYPHRGRLNNKTKRDGKTNTRGVQYGAWCSSIQDKNQYLQVDLLRKRNISAVATQGYRFSMFVEKFRLNYSIDGISWMPCRDEHGQIEFKGNNDNETIQKNSLQFKVDAKYIRFNPTDWDETGYICMRVEIYECMPVKGSVPGVHQRLSRFSDVDDGGSINLTCIMKGQVGIRIKWFKQNMLIQDSDTTRLKATEVGNSGMLSMLSLSKIEMADNGIKYECRGSYPGVNTLFASTTTVLRVGADQPPLRLDSRTTNSLILNVPYRLFNRTKTFWFEYKPKDSNAKQWKEKYLLPSDKAFYTIDGLKAWTLYEVRVTPIHKDVKGRTSVTKFFRTAEGVPSSPPRNVKIIQINEYNTTIQWKPPKEENIHGIIKKYIIRLTDKTNIDEKPLEVDVSHGTNHTIDSLLPDTQYMFKICTETGGGKGPFSSFHDFTTRKENEITSTLKPEKEKLNLENLNEINITQENVISVAADVKNLTSEADKLKAKDIALTAEILEKIVETNNINAKVGDSILATISHVLDVENAVLLESNTRHKTSSKFVKILEEYTRKGGQFSKNTSNIIVRVDPILKSHSEGVVKVFNNNTSITIPKEVLKGAENKTMFFIYYKNGKLFKPKRFIKEICMKNGFTEMVYQTSTPVLSSAIAGKSVKGLSHRVIITFTVADPKAVKASSSCVYWDFNGAGGAGDWSSKGCKRRRVYNNTIECACDHMTNFAALLDIYAATSRSCGVHAVALTTISFIGCVLSIAGLSLTIFTYLFFRRLRKELAAKILIQLCIALLCVLLVFIIGIERSRVGPVGCYVVAVLLHYFILTAFMWMFIEAHFMYLAFVRVWSQHGDHELLKCSFIAWGLPAIVVGVTMAVNLDNYGGTHYCRIQKIPFYVAFFAPVLCIVFINLIVFAVILYKLNTRPDSSAGRGKNAKYKRMKQAVGIMILVGVTWSFGALAISKARLIFHYLFAIFNSIQGFSIFLFYCLSQKNVRDSWKALLTCNLDKLQKDKSFYTNTYDRRRCSTASTTHNNTLSLARKKASTSSGNMAYPSHSMDSLTREFTSYNCSSGTLRLEGNSKQNNLNNAVSKNVNVKDDKNENNPEIWKRRSNLLGDDDPLPSSSLTDVRLRLAKSAETLYSQDGTENYGSYDLVANSNSDSLLSLDSSDLHSNQTLDKQGCYSFVNSHDSLGSSCKNSHDNSIGSEGISLSAPATPAQIKRPRPSPLSRKKQTTLPLSFEKPKCEVNHNHTSDPLGLRDDFGKLIVSPCRRSVRGVIGVVETSVDTYDEDSPNMMTPQGVRLTQDFKDEQSDTFDPDECVASPTYFAENCRVSRGSKDRNSSTNESSVGDVFL